MYLGKFFRSPNTILTIISSQLLIPIYLKLENNVSIGHGCKFLGWPQIRCNEQAKIVIWNNVTLNSLNNSNVAGINHSVIIAAVSPGAIIIIGENCGISGASIVARDKIIIGENVLIGADVCIWDNDFHPLSQQDRYLKDESLILAKPVIIGDNVFIGARSIILKGVTVGENAIIGAGSVVTKSVQSGDIVAGNPARSVRK